MESCRTATSMLSSYYQVPDGYPTKDPVAGKKSQSEKRVSSACAPEIRFQRPVRHARQRIECGDEGRAAGQLYARYGVGHAQAERTLIRKDSHGTVATASQDRICESLPAATVHGKR